MDFKECLEMGADFMDMHNPGIVYLISEFVKLKKFGLPPIADGIRVQDCMTGEIIGVVENKTLEEMYGDIDKLIGLDEEVEVEKKDASIFNDKEKENDPSGFGEIEQSVPEINR